MAESSLLIGIDVGTTKVCALVADMEETPSGGAALRILGVGLAPSQGMRKGVVVDVDQASRSIAEAVDKAQRAAGYEIGAAFVSLAGAHVSSVNSRGVVGISGGYGIDQDDIDRALDNAQAIAIPHGREVLHIIPRGFIVDGQEGIRQPLGMHGFRLEVEAHIITAATASVQNLTKCVEAAGVQVEAYVLNPLASAEVVLTDTEKEMGVVVVDIGGGTSDMAIYIDGNVWHTTVLAVGGAHLTSDIAHGLRLPADIAEQVKIQHGHAYAADVPLSDSFTVQPFGEDQPSTVSRFDLASIIEARVEEIFGLILQEIKRTGYDGLLPAGVVLTGGTSQLPGIRKVAGNVLNLPCRVAAPQGLQGLVDKLSGPAYSTSVGLLHWANRESQVAARSTGNKKKRGRTINIEKGLDFFKRLLP
ncbi:MAG TPA: cell division protein FtsA [Anaerolineales bacterium]|nr:cell division protein FtsA [Anaerolineales bacterium]HRF48949.1 cell division protein FtsA [Anaerolineales bacterium]